MSKSAIAQTGDVPGRVRCVIYTRKSSEEGLEQDFNSLDAQREACAAYVLSQASEGWQLVPERYDDGGVSGGTLVRPALQRLLSDIDARRIDIVVVYKVDRLTRSLLDFAKLVERFDSAGASFVSVTQSFNTTTSMGRLTLNMLLSFAQFEREVTAERIRDKIAASKAKGMWMGGTPPLGYRPDERSLAVVEEHAALIRLIYSRYLELGSVRLLADTLCEEGIGAPLRQRQSGMSFGGVAFTRGQLYAILRNPVYIGMIVHKGRTFAGRHAAIIEQQQWDAVQAELAAHVRGNRKHRQASKAWLAGKLFDEAGEPLISVHACKKGVRYRYYVSRAKHHRRAKGMRLPAGQIEGHVAKRLATWLSDPFAVIEFLQFDVEPHQLSSLCAQTNALGAALHASANECRDLIHVVHVRERRVDIEIDAAALAARLGTARLSEVAPHYTLTDQVQLTRTGMVVRLLDQSGCKGMVPAPDDALLRLLAKARSWWQVLKAGDDSLAALAAREGVSTSWLTRVLRLAFLSPNIIDAALEGRLRAGINQVALLQTGAVPAMWWEQEAHYLA